MSTKSKHQATKKDQKKDLATFERLPKKTKELMKLQEEDEKKTGSDQVETTRKIEKEARKQRP